MNISPVAEASHRGPCPWCGQSRIRGIGPSPDGNRWYRCAACATTFYIHLTARSQPGPEDEHCKLELDAAV
jgi:transposase-like protein